MVIVSKFHEYRDYVITKIIFDTGMRIGECLLIKTDTDINFNERTIFLPADNTKGKICIFFSTNGNITKKVVTINKN